MQLMAHVKYSENNCHVKPSALMSRKNGNINNNNRDAHSSNQKSVEWLKRLVSDKKADTIFKHIILPDFSSQPQSLEDTEACI
jgi:hypothetical protein